MHHGAPPPISLKSDWLEGFNALEGFTGLEGSQMWIPCDHTGLTIYLSW